MSDLEIVKLLGTRFIVRKDVKAFQSTDGQWRPDKCPDCLRNEETCFHRPMTVADFDSHLSGERTMGHYLVSPVDQTCKLFAFDLDVRKPIGPDRPEPYQPLDDEGQPYNPREALLADHPMRPFLRTQLRCVAEGLAIRVNSLLGIPVAISDSGGKGLHVYCFTGQIPAESARDLAQKILGDWCYVPVRGENFWRHRDPELYQEIEIETFPKQATVSEDGLGNLMKLPLGVHRKTGNPSRFLTTKSPLEVWVEMDAKRALEGDLPWE